MQIKLQYHNTSRQKGNIPEKEREMVRDDDQVKKKANKILCINFVYKIKADLKFN